MDQLMNAIPPKQKKFILWAFVALLMLSGVIVLFFSFRGGKGDEPALSEIDVIYTDAMLTRNALQTLQAGASVTPGGPIALTTPTPTATLFSGLGTPITTFTPVGTNACDSSVYIADVTIPDGTSVTAGQTFTKTWKVSNTGTCTWTAAYQIMFISGDAMSGKAVQIGKEVKPGETIEVSVPMTAPSSAGTIKGTWRLSNDKSQPFGTLLTIEIKVGGPTATPTKNAYPNP